jgi:hypothetical protein
LTNASNLFELPQVTIVPKTQCIHLMAKLHKSEHPGLIHLTFDMYKTCTIGLCLHFVPQGAKNKFAKVSAFHPEESITIS